MVVTATLVNSHTYLKRFICCTRSGRNQYNRYPVMSPPGGEVTCGGESSLWRDDRKPDNLAHHKSHSSLVVRTSDLYTGGHDELDSFRGLR